MNPVEEYNAMRIAIQRNIDAIRSLIEQANELTNTVNEMTDTKIREQLLNQVKGLNAIINTLVDETDKLFKSYIDLANAVVIVPS